MPCAQLCFRLSCEDKRLTRNGERQRLKGDKGRDKKRERERENEHTPNIFQVSPNALGSTHGQSATVFLLPLTPPPPPPPTPRFPLSRRSNTLAQGQSRAAIGFGRCHGDQRDIAAIATQHRLLKRSSVAFRRAHGVPLIRSASFFINTYFHN